MKTKSIRMALIAVIVLLGCSACTEQSEKRTAVSFSEKRDNVKMSEIIKDYSLIPLETQGKNLILDVSMMRIWNNRIYILDCFAQDKTVWVYDMQGKYIGRIGSIGQGPGEYIMPMAMLVNEADNQILIKDVAQNKLLFYDAETLSYIKDLNIPFYSDCLEYLGKDRLIWYVGSGWVNQGDFQKHIQITDMDLNVIDSYIPRLDLPKRGLYNVMSYFHRLNKEVYFHHPLMEDVFKYQNEVDSIAECYSVSFGELSLPSMAYLKDNENNVIGQLEKDGFVQYYEIQENDRKMLCYFGVHNKAHIAVYDKLDETGYYTETEKLIDDLGILKFVRPKTTYNDSFVSVIYVEDLETLSNNSIIYPLLKDKEDGGNPIVLMYK